MTTIFLHKKASNSALFLQFVLKKLILSTKLLF